MCWSLSQVKCNVDGRWCVRVRVRDGVCDCACVIACLGLRQTVCSLRCTLLTLVAKYGLYVFNSSPSAMELSTRVCVAPFIM